MSVTAGPNSVSTDPNAAEREAARVAWVRAATGENDLQPQRASVDAGFRSYWRVQTANGSRIVMDSPPQLEDVRPWLRMRALLASGGVRVPEVIVEDAAAGFLLLEDLGGPTLAQVLDDDNADAHFDAALEQLLRLQAIQPPLGTGAFGEALLQRDAGLFEEWFLRRHLGLELDCDDTDRIELVQRRLMDNALQQAQVLTHRDFMPRNLMPVAGGPAVLDFQDCVTGAVAYDPVSLFKDAFLSWPLERVDGWLARYHERALAARIPVPPLHVFQRDADWLGVQRHLKILGIFSRLHYRDGKTKYLPDAPRFIAYLDEVLPRYRELDALREVLDARIRPAMARIASSAS
ncbi:aminoglycoside phosphotransferase family protein [Lysobacter panacisoli]|uniref:Phosphotransferase n=1 Tax=Lysobacter panacisoli TaxID=1255263 RepID=A0ABP9LG38_9GAMM|nr:phosphotransferase [Lysobacter panacisoli]